MLAGELSNVKVYEVGKHESMVIARSGLHMLCGIQRSYLVSYIIYIVESAVG